MTHSGSFLTSDLKSMSHNLGPFYPSAATSARDVRLLLRGVSLFSCGERIGSSALRHGHLKWLGFRVDDIPASFWKPSRFLVSLPLSLAAAVGFLNSIMQAAHL